MKTCHAAIPILVLALLVNPALAQDGEQSNEPGPWVQKVGVELMFNQGFYTTNWQGDEKTSGSLTATLGHTAQKQLARPLRFEHDMELAFGEQATRQEDDTWDVSKSEDKIRLDELLRFTLGFWVDPLASVQLKSQFFSTDTSDKMHWLNPLQLLETVGVGRRFFDREARTLTSELGAAARQLWDVTAEPDQVADAGVSWITAFRSILGSPNAEYKTRLTLYKPLVAFQTGGELGTLPEVDWENAVSARFTKALSGKLYVQMLYDDKTDETPRLKQTLGLGLSLAWPSGEES
ncbi:MAG: DUF3078 domain-containing protein [candidate division WOR-3 bacterium]|nr:MAG: DUF3078 domain-containing protein [candidate division WOR-3 bacterium]